MRKIALILIFGNFLGACSTFFYFNFVLPSGAQAHGVPDYYDILFFLAVTSLMGGGVFFLKRRIARGLAQVAGGRKEISSFPRDMVSHLQREALRYPMIVTLISFGVWVVSGFVFSFVEPLITAVIYDVAVPDLVLCIRRFLGIVLLGGGVTCMVLFFVVENAWQTYLPAFFPQGHLNRVKHGFRISVRSRLMIVLLGIVLIPLPIAWVILISNIKKLHMADALTRTQAISSLYWEMGYVTLDTLIIVLILAYLLSKSIVAPLDRIKRTVKAVEKNDLTSRVAITSNDELGEVAQGVNAMVVSLDESRKTRDSFGRYMCKEIREQIISNGTELEGEMKRATLVFSDLRNFTGLVEKNHPREVVKILNQYFTEMTLAVKAHKGLILQYVGDEVEAVFGAPVGFEDHPEMAVQAALEMRRRLGELNERLADQGIPALDHGIGIHSGAVLAGNIGSQERLSYALVGDTVNTASRIEGLSKVYGADIILSQTTHSLLTNTYETEQLPPVRVKGKDQEIIVYKLIS